MQHVVQADIALMENGVICVLQVHTALQEHQVVLIALPENTVAQMVQRVVQIALMVNIALKVHQAVLLVLKDNTVIVVASGVVRKVHILQVQGWFTQLNVQLAKQELILA